MFLDLIEDGEDTDQPGSVLVNIYDINWAVNYDQAGWQNTNRPPLYYKTDYPRCRKGIQEGEQYIRFSSAAWLSDSFLRTYDTEENRRDFECNRYSGSVKPMTYRALNVAAGTMTALSGIPAYGALVSVNDLFSNSTSAYRVTITTASGGLTYPAALFTLEGVSTGTWTVEIASGNFYSTISSVTMTFSGQTQMVPSSATVPVWVTTGAAHTLLVSTGVYGYVSGFVWDSAGTPLAGIQLVVAGIPKTTNAQGFYYAAVATGPVTVIINPGNANSAYVSDTFDVTVTQGQVTNVNDYLQRGGTLKGYVTSGVSALPNISVVATRSGLQMGSGTSDNSGYFYIQNLSTGDYTVQPALDPVADASPDNFTATVVQGQTVFVGTFTVTGAYGTITGRVKKGGASITTGVLVIASSTTIASTPPTIVASSAPAQNVFYSASSASDGTYTLLVRGATSYAYNIRAWYPRISGNTVTTDTVSYAGVNVNSGQTVNRDITFP